VCAKSACLWWCVRALFHACFGMDRVESKRLTGIAVRSGRAGRPAARRGPCREGHSGFRLWPCLRILQIDPQTAAGYVQSPSGSGSTSTQSVCMSLRACLSPFHSVTVSPFTSNAALPLVLILDACHSVPVPVPVLCSWIPDFKAAITIQRDHRNLD
jgi:hypothetical protein